MLLILSHADDPHVAAVTRHMRPDDFEIFEPGDFPLDSTIRMELSGSHVKRALECRGRSVDLDDVDVVWHRRPGSPGVKAAVADASVAAHSNACSVAAMSDLWASLDCVHFPAMPHLVRYASYKFTQLRLASKIGFEIPATVVTNEGDRLISFFNEHLGEIVSKVALPPSAVAEAWYLSRYTEPVAHRDLAFAASLRFCPAILQPLIRKAYEIRVTVIGDEIFAVRIDSQVTASTKVDWRRYDLENTPHSLVSMPDRIERMCHQLVRQLGLRFGALDLIVTPDGRYVFLELNPNGQWLWLEKMTGAPLSAAMARCLSRTYE